MINATPAFAGNPAFQAKTTADGHSPARAIGPLRMIVLAGGRSGTDPLARDFGISHRCLIPLAGRPLVAHVLQTAAMHPMVESLAVSVEPEAFGGLYDVLSQLPGRGIVKLVEARSNLADSVLAAAQDWEGPLLITTADHALLTLESIDALLEGLAHADVAVALATRESVLESMADAGEAKEIRFHEFADGAYASCNLFAVAGPRALGAAEVFRGGGRFAGAAWRTLRAFGLVNLILLRLHAVSLTGAMARVSTRLKLRIAPVVLGDGSQALDVDDLHTHGLAEGILHDRGPAAEKTALPLTLRRAQA